MTNHFSPLEANVRRIYRHDRQHSFGTKKRYRESCLVFARFAWGVFKLQKFKNVSDKHIVAFIRHRQEQGAAPKTIKNDLASIRYAHGKSEPRHSISPNEDLAGNYGVVLEPTPTVKGNRAWTDIEYNSALTYARNNGHQEISEIMILCRTMGLRITEAVAVHRSQAEAALRTGFYLVRNEAKGGMWRALPLSPGAREVFIARLENTPRGHRLYIKPEEQTHKAVKRCEEWLNKARSSFETTEGRTLRTWQGNIKEITFHGLRYAYVQQRMAELTAAGLSWDDAAEIVSKEIGHRRINVIKVYMGGMQG